MKKYRITSGLATILLSIFMLCFSIILVFHLCFVQHTLYRKAYSNHSVTTIDGKKASVTEASFNYEVFTSCFLPTGNHAFELPSISSVEKKSGTLSTLLFLYSLLFYGGICSLILFGICLIVLHKRHRYRCFFFAPIIALSLSGIASLAVAFLPVKRCSKLISIIFHNRYDYLPFTKEFISILPKDLFRYELFISYGVLILVCTISFFIYRMCYRKKSYRF